MKTTGHPVESRPSLSRTNSITTSIRSSISAIQHRATRYRKYVILSSILLTLSSTAIIFYSLVLIKWYLMPNLRFWDEQFYNAPYFLLSLGIFKLIVAMYGLTINRYKNRCLLTLFSFLLVVAFIMQLVSIGFFWSVRTSIILGEISGAKIIDMLKGYEIDPYITESMDYMQQHLSCCGGSEWQTGYIDYKYTSFGKNNKGVPDSCCIDEHDGCGRDIYSKHERLIKNEIYTNGCVGILRKWVNTDILPMIWAYTFTGLGIALCDILSAVLVCAYIAQISRRYLKTEDKNFVNIIQYGMFGSKDIHYPRLPDTTFVGVKVSKPVKERKSGKNIFDLRRALLGHPASKSDTYSNADINRSVSEFLSHGIGPEISHSTNTNDIEKDKKHSLTKTDDNIPTDMAHGKDSISTSNEKKVSQKISVESYSTQSKEQENTLKSKTSITNIPEKSINCNEGETQTRTRYKENKIANLRKAWIRDNMTLHKHPSVLATNSLTSVENDPTLPPVSREVRSLTPEKPPPKPIRVRISAYNNSQAASLETNL